MCGMRLFYSVYVECVEQGFSILSILYSRLSTLSLSLSRFLLSLLRFWESQRLAGSLSTRGAKCANGIWAAHATWRVPVSSANGNTSSRSNYLNLSFFFFRTKIMDDGAFAWCEALHWITSGGISFLACLHVLCDHDITVKAMSLRANRSRISSKSQFISIDHSLTPCRRRCGWLIQWSYSPGTL
jgi:hypothetical protein